jgi:hypothetical protein
MRRRTHLSLLGIGLLACSNDPTKPSIQLDAATDGGDAPVVVVKDAPVDTGDAPVNAGDVAMVGETAVDTGELVPQGRWTTGDLHVHTIQSNDAQTPQSHLSVVLEAAFKRNKLDWVTLSNHLRVSDKDHEGNNVSGGPIPLSKGIALFEIPAITALQKAGTYADKTIFSSVEWDMPTHEHFNIGIVSDAAGSHAAVKALNQFEYLFTNRDPAMFAPADVSAWGAQRWHTTHADAIQAIGWLKQHHPDSSYGLISHPSRYPDRYKISDFREFNDLAPQIVFAIEGMVGNQMEPDRGGYASPYIEANAHSRTYGGVDSVVAKRGGIWDALLGEGRRIWNVGNSDYHFKTAGNMFSSGYFPGEYTRNYVWVEGQGMPAILKGLRAGKVFTVNGDLISALEFDVSAPQGSAQMGSELLVTSGTPITIKIRFKSDIPSKFETPVGSGNVPGALPVVHHVDVIAGDVTTRAQPGTPAYATATNPSSQVVARFTASEWTTDAQGYRVMTHTLTATKDQYFRLRGSNLSPDVPGETQNGEPLPDAKIDTTDPAARFNAINDRNYADLWFYSNPIFVKVR